MIKQNTDRKFSESFTRMQARVNTVGDASLFEFVKSSPTAILVLGEQLKLQCCSSWTLQRIYRHMTERSTGETVLLDLLL